VLGPEVAHNPAVAEIVEIAVDDWRVEAQVEGVGHKHLGYTVVAAAAAADMAGIVEQQNLSSGIAHFEDIVAVASWGTALAQLSERMRVHIRSEVEGLLVGLTYCRMVGVLEWSVVRLRYPFQHLLDLVDSFPASGCPLPIFFP